jgi:hypothetical protein
MNSGQRRTLKAVFAVPTPKTLPWSDVESLFRAVGCEVTEREGTSYLSDMP